MHVKEAEKMNNDFKSNRKLFWSWVKRARQGQDKGVCGIKIRKWFGVKVKFQNVEEYSEDLYGNSEANQNTQNNPTFYEC